MSKMFDKSYSLSIPFVNQINAAVDNVNSQLRAEQKME